MYYQRCSGVEGGFLWSYFDHGLVLRMSGLYVRIKKSKRWSDCPRGGLRKALYESLCTLKIMLLCNENYNTAVLSIFWSVTR